MSFLGGKSKEKDPFSKKSHFYVEFLGWMECRGVRGQRYTDPVIRELRRRQKKMDTPPKLTIQVSRKDLKITQDVEEKKKRSIRKIKFPTIPARDVTFVHQATRSQDGRLDDIVACIYLGYMPRTQRYVHVHVYRFDEASTATTFARQMAALVEANLDHIREVELDLTSKGEIEDPRLMSSDGMSDPHTNDSAVGSTSSAYSDDGSPTFGSDDIDPDLQSLKDVQPFDSVADELRFRLQMGDQPLLFPPKDYDTISRAHGNVIQADQRRCLNLNIVGENAVNKDTRTRNGSSESGVELPSPGSDAAESNGKSPVDKHLQPNTAFRNSPLPSPVQHHRTGSFPDSRNSPAVSPTQQRKQMYFQEGRNSPQVPHKPTMYRDPNTSPTSEFAYPPKMTSPPMSPAIYRPIRGNQISRQTSQSSQNSDHDYQHHNNAPQHQNNAHYYKVGSSEDIYTMPQKGFRRPANNFSANDEIPPDYNDDFSDGVQLRDMNPRYQHSHSPGLTRSMPADLIRSEMALGSSSRPNSGDLRQLRRIDSPVFMANGQYGHNSGYNSPRIHRVNSGKR